MRNYVHKDNKNFATTHRDLINDYSRKDSVPELLEWDYDLSPEALREYLAQCGNDLIGEPMNIDDGFALLDSWESED